MKRFGLIFAGITALLGFTGIPGHCDNYSWGKTENGASVTVNEGTTQVSSNTAVAGTKMFISVSSPTATTNLGAANQFNYITDIHIEMYATATVSGGSTPVSCTTTGLPGSPVFLFPTAQAIGTISFYNIDYVSPLRATTAGNAVTITCPATTSILWNGVVNYYQDN